MKASNALLHAFFYNNQMIRPVVRLELEDHGRTWKEFTAAMGDHWDYSAREVLKWLEN